jgi:acyl carrier protein
MTNEELTNWFKEKIAEESGTAIENIKTDQTFDNFNLDSLSTVTLAYDLEKEIGIDIDPTIFYEFDTIDKLVEKIQTPV